MYIYINIFIHIYKYTYIYIDVSNIKSFDDLPVNCKAYVLRLEELIGVPIRYIIPEYNDTQLLM
jgi:adenylosuccinate synthase